MFDTDDVFYLKLYNRKFFERKTIFAKMMRSLSN